MEEFATLIVFGNLMLTSPSSFVAKVLDAYPDLKDNIVLVECTLVAVVLIWFTIPAVLRRLHQSEGPALLLCGTKLWGTVPYQKSVYSALQGPLRCFVTFIAFSILSIMVAPQSSGARYAMPSWLGAIFTLEVWFLYRWKENILSRGLAATNIAAAERSNLLALRSISTICLLFNGLIALGAALEVAMGFTKGVLCTIMTGLIGASLLGLLVPFYAELATFIASKDLIRDVRSGLRLLITGRLAVGDEIEVKSEKGEFVRGHVTEIGLTTTNLRAEGVDIILPNSAVVKSLYGRINILHPNALSNFD